MHFIIVCGMFVWCSLCVYVDCVKCFAHVQCYCDCTFWLKPVSMVIFMLRSAVLIEWLLLKP